MGALDALGGCSGCTGWALWVPWVGALGAVGAGWVPWVGVLGAGWALGGHSLSPLTAHPQLVILAGPFQLGISDDEPGLLACPQPREMLGRFHPGGSRFPG